MVVKTQRNGQDNFGLRVGAANARRYFPRSVGAVELLLDDLRIECQLPESFWNGHPEINDPRLCAWLKFKVFQQCRTRDAIALHLVQSGANTFKLHPKALLGKRELQMTSVA
jgi:hypothetical protein